MLNIYQLRHIEKIIQECDWNNLTHMQKYHLSELDEYADLPDEKFCKLINQLEGAGLFAIVDYLEETHYGNKSFDAPEDN